MITNKPIMQENENRASEDIVLVLFVVLGVNKTCQPVNSTSFFNGLFSTEKHICRIARNCRLYNGVSKIFILTNIPIQNKNLMFSHFARFWELGRMINFQHPPRINVDLSFSLWIVPPSICRMDESKWCFNYKIL